jgi:hypothetical protein
MRRWLSSRSLRVPFLVHFASLSAQGAIFPMLLVRILITERGGASFIAIITAKIKNYNLGLLFFVTVTSATGRRCSARINRARGKGIFISRVVCASQSFRSSFIDIIDVIDNNDARLRSGHAREVI